MRRIVLLEGGEGVGKTTHAKRLEKEHGFLYLKFPTPKSQWEQRIFSKETSKGEKAIAATLDFIDVLRGVNKQYGENVDIVMDRGPLSTAAYQGPDYLFDAVDVLNARWMIELITDIFVLDIDVETGLSREAVQNEVSKAGLEFHTQVNAKMRDAYWWIKKPWGPHNIESNTMPVDWIAFGQLPWTENIQLIDTKVLNEQAVYSQILEQLGLAKTAQKS